MQLETINATALRTKTRDLMEQVKFNGARFVIHTFGRPMAVLISVDDFARIQDALDAVPVVATPRRRIQSRKTRPPNKRKLK